MVGRVLVLDIGKTHARALTFDADGAMLTRKQVALVPVVGRDYRELPLEAILRFIDGSVAAAAAAGGPLAVIPVTHGAAAVLIDANGPVLPALDYEDAGPETAADYDAVRPAFDESLSPALPLGLNLGRQLAWLEATRPAAFARARTILTLPQFVGWHLTGTAVSEATSLGCHTDLWAPRRNDFSTLVHRRGWRAKFPPVRDAGEAVGVLHPRFGPSGATVLNGLHDSNASLVPHLGRAEAFTMISSGTWIIAMAVGGTVPADLPAARDCLANVDARGRPYPCARFMGGREYAALAGGAAATLDDVATVAQAIAAGRMILPNHAEGGGPFPGARGSVPDMAESERAALATLYLALMTDTCCDLIGAGGPIIVEGPAAANPLFGALVQALHPDRPVAASIDTDATARGAAMLALGIAGRPETVPAARVAVPGLREYAAAWQLSAAGS